MDMGQQSTRKDEECIMRLLLCVLLLFVGGCVQSFADCELVINYLEADDVGHKAGVL